LTDPRLSPPTTSIASLAWAQILDDRGSLRPLSIMGQAKLALSSLFTNAASGQALVAPLSDVGSSSMGASSTLMLSARAAPLTAVRALKPGLTRGRRHHLGDHHQPVRSYLIDVPRRIWRTSAKATGRTTPRKGLVTSSAVAAAGIPITKRGSKNKGYSGHGCARHRQPLPPRAEQPKVRANRAD
jgi:hypothetical protein